MRRCAFDLDFLISRQPRESPSLSTTTSQNGGNDSINPSKQSAIAPRNLAPNELEYLDVFGFFNVPRVPPTRAPDSTAATNANANSHLDITGSVQDPMSIHGLTSNPPVVEGNPTVSANEFNITNYLIPTPETDWLFRPTG